MPETILVTGGGGFVGSHLVDALLARGYRVRVLDLLDPQVHGPAADGGEGDGRVRRPEHLAADAEFLQGDVRDPEIARRALDGVDAAFYQAAAVGVGQSMYQIRHYVDANTLGAATFLDVVANTPAVRHRLRRLVVASSMSIYGEGAYRCPACGADDLAPPLRPRDQLERRQWELRCPTPGCAGALEPVPTPETKPLQPNSVYAITKRDHEELFLVVGRAYQLPTIALRYFGIYGPRQALSNPYTGVAAIFSSRLLAGRPPVIYEDGRQTRDFVHVSDIVQANLEALDAPAAAHYEAYNVGTGRAISVREVADLLAQRMGIDIQPQVLRKFREGDIRHCSADIGKARRILGYAPQVPFEQGLVDLVAWVRQQEGRVQDGFEQVQRELTAHGLVTGRA